MIKLALADGAGRQDDEEHEDDDGEEGGDDGATGSLAEAVELHTYGHPVRPQVAVVRQVHDRRRTSINRSAHQAPLIHGSKSIQRNHRIWRGTGRTQ